MQAAPQDSLPATGFVRIATIVGDTKRGIPALLPISESTWHAGVRDGRFPAPVKLGKRAVAWRVSDIRKLIAEGLQP